MLYKTGLIEFTDYDYFIQPFLVTNEIIHYFDEIFIEEHSVYYYVSMVM